MSAKLESVTQVWSQEVDCCQSPGDLLQELTISTHDGGGGWYVTIATERWALDADDLDAFMDRVKALLKQKEVA